MNDQLDDPSHNAGWSPEGPFLVADHEGRGWYARPHGGLTRREDELLDAFAQEHYGDEDSVRLVRRGADTEQFGRLTIAGARELSAQLRSAADTAEDRRNQRYAQNSVDAEQERQQGESGRYTPENESSLNLLRHYQRDGESLEQALERLVREGRNMRPWKVAVTISQTLDDAWSARYHIELLPASGTGLTFWDLAGRDVNTVPGLVTVWGDEGQHIHYGPNTDKVAVTGYHSHLGGERHVHGANGWSNTTASGKGMPDGTAGTGRSNGVLEEGMSCDGFDGTDVRQQRVAGQLWQGRSYVPGDDHTERARLDPAYPGMTPEPFVLLTMYVDSLGTTDEVPVARSWAQQAEPAHYEHVERMLRELPHRRLARIVGHGDQADGWMACNEGDDGNGSWIIDYEQSLATGGSETATVRHGPVVTYRNTFESQDVDDVVARGPAPQPPSADLADYEQSKLSEMEREHARQLHVPAGRSTDAASIQNARIRREIAMATWDER